MGSASEFGENFKLSTGSDQQSVELLEGMLGLQFPASYRRFLLNSNGGEGFLGSDNFLRLWSVKEIESHFSGYRFAELLPGYAPIGTDGGGEALVIRTKGNSVEFGFVPFGDMVEGSFIPISQDFEHAIKLIGEGKAFQASSNSH